VEANQTYDLTLEGLTPARSYTIMVSAKNNDTRFPRTMRDDIMARVEVITRAEQRDISRDDGSDGLLLVVKTMLILVLVF
jgi:hypothetical protein